MVGIESVGPYIVSSDQHRANVHGIDDVVCWSRMQAEAGQTIESILARKEVERLAGNGHFLWGVGNAPAVAIRALVRFGRRIPVVFSTMKTRAKAVDTSPARILIWRKYIDTYVVEKPLPGQCVGHEPW